MSRCLYGQNFRCDPPFLKKTYYFVMSTFTITFFASFISLSTVFFVNQKIGTVGTVSS